MANEAHKIKLLVLWDILCKNTDENHALKQDLTFDDVHLYAQYYDKWVKYLKNHAVVKGE